MPHSVNRRKPVTRRAALRAFAVWGASPWIVTSGRASIAGGAPKRADPPYRLEFEHPLADLIGDLEDTERGDTRRESETPHDQWYSEQTRRRHHAWGPLPRRYAPLPHLRAATVAWKRERVIATAARFLGYGYQHHHLPDWDPPPGWPWKPTCVGHNGKGVDCSNLTSFVYNQGFGIRMTSAIRDQAVADRALKGRDDSIPLRPIELPRGFRPRCQALRTGDLVFIRGREDGAITHVVIWVGAIGRSPDDVPLVLDSHGAGVSDEAGRPIPCGVQLRPFRENSWYNRCASHAHRIFSDPA